MSGYFYTLLVASVCGAVCMMLAWGGFEKYIKYIASLVCVVLLISPLRQIDISGSFEMPDGISEESQIPSDTEALPEQITKANAEKYISDLVFSKFGINAVSVNIKIEWGKTEAVITDMVLVLKHPDIRYSEEIKAYLFSVLGGEVRVVEEE